MAEQVAWELVWLGMCGHLLPGSKLPPSFRTPLGVGMKYCSVSSSEKHLLRKLEACKRFIGGRGRSSVCYRQGGSRAEQRKPWTLLQNERLEREERAVLDKETLSPERALDHPENCGAKAEPSPSPASGALGAPLGSAREGLSLLKS